MRIEIEFIAMQHSKVSEGLRELFVGTWIGYALLADALIRARILRRDDVDSMLSDAERAVNSSRCVPLTAVRKLLRRLPESRKALRRSRRF